VSIRTTIWVEELSAQLTPRSEKNKSRRAVPRLTEEEAKT
jgi:hypothetical protein